VLNQTQHQLKQVLSHYDFEKLCRCGLSDCRTAHRDGFLVETTDGLETNVGHVCGKKAFPDFDLKRAEYKALRERRDLLDRASAIKSNVTGIRNRIAELDTAQFGSVWVESVRAAVGKVLGSDLFDSLRIAQMRGDLAVRIERERSAAEIKQIIDLNPRQRREQVRTETITVGYLEPMPWLTFAFKGKLRDGLLGELKHFACANHASMATPTLKRAVKALDGYERVVDEACEAAGGAVKFFAPELSVPGSMGARPHAQPPSSCGGMGAISAMQTAGRRATGELSLGVRVHGCPAWEATRQRRATRTADHSIALGEAHIRQRLGYRPEGAAQERRQCRLAPEATVFRRDSPLAHAYAFASAGVNVMPRLPGVNYLERRSR
jgi:hypothetical protein